MTETLTDPQTLTVEYDELMARADELEAPLPGLPVDHPFPPSSLAHATGAAAQLSFSTDDMGRYLAAGQQEWSKLAQSLRNAAKAYEEADELAAEAIENDMSVSTVTPSAAGDEVDVFTLMVTDTSAEVIPLPSYYPVTEAAYDIAEPDQGVAFDGFAAQWSSFQRTLVEATARFRPFEYWDGESTYAVEANMAKHRDWLFQMADLCGKMATQARSVAAAQRWALPRHPTAEQISELEKAWYYYQTEPEYWPEVKVQLEEKLRVYQEQSTEVLDEYANQASLPLSPAKPPLPPIAQPTIDPPTQGNDDDDDESDDPADIPEGGETPEDTEDDLPYDPSAGSRGSSGAGAPSGADDTDSLTTVPPTAFPDTSAGGGVKPASFGGTGGGFGGGGGVPAMPLQPSTGAVSGQPAATMASVAAMPGAGSGARAPMGAGGMGMPMGGGHGGQNQNKQAKRIEQDDDALYTEDRPWTAAVIGNRRRNDTPEL